MSGLSSYDVRPVVKSMKIPLTSEIVASYASGTRATGRFDSQKQLVTHDLAWEVAA